MKPTKVVPDKITRDWHLIDMKGQILGRQATKIAEFLMGKNKPSFARLVDGGDYVVVINASGVILSGKKESQKIYYRHSGYPGGLKAIPFKKQMQEDPRKVITHAVSGMLPQNHLHDRMLTRLFVFPGSEHPHKDKLKENAKN
jgi:large subunit ribosomal protein L13